MGTVLEIRIQQQLAAEKAEAAARKGEGGEGGGAKGSPSLQL